MIQKGDALWAKGVPHDAAHAWIAAEDEDGSHVILAAREGWPAQFTQVMPVEMFELPAGKRNQTLISDTLHGHDVELSRKAALDAEIGSLLREIMQMHADPDAPEYNECDTSPCNWCERAAKLIGPNAAGQLPPRLMPYNEKAN